jgi:hypothetical protein
MVWVELERYLSQPEIILTQLEAQRQEADQIGVFEVELERIEPQLKAVNGEQHQLLQWALKGFPENQVEAENKRLNRERETLNRQKEQLVKQIKACQDADINIPQLKRFIECIQGRIHEVDFEGKRLALDMLGITVWVDGGNVEITGTIDPSIVLTPSSLSTPPLKHTKEAW